MISVHNLYTPRTSAEENSILNSVLAQVSSEEKSTPETPPAAKPVQWRLPGFEGKCRVATNFGDLPIEALRKRDMVRTLSGAYREVKWVDAIRLDVEFLERHPEAAPVQLQPKSLAGAFPRKTMLVSPGQSICAPRDGGSNSVMRAGDLLSRPNIMRAQRAEVTYYRFHCGQNEIISIGGGWFATGPED